MCILNVGISKCFFEQYYLLLLFYCFVVLQVYWINNVFFIYVEIVIFLLNFCEIGLEEFVEMVIFYVINCLRYYCEEQVIDDVLQWLKSMVEKMYDKEQFSELVLENMVVLLVKLQEYLM